MRELKRFLVTLSIFIGFLVIGMTASYLAGFQTGRFLHWKELRSNLKFEKIADATLKIVWARTIDGGLYFWDTSCSIGPDCNRWIPAKDTPDTDYTYGGQATKRFNACPSSSLKDLAVPPGDVDECVLFSSSGSDIKSGRLVYYALLDDGRIWTLKSGYPPLDILGSGFLIGAAAFVVFMMYRRKNKVKTDIGNKEQNLQNLKSFLLSFLLFIGFSVAGIAIGYFFGATYADLKGEGKFSHWRELGGNLKFEQIVDATSQIIWARTADGTLYSLDTNCARGTTCYEWIEAKEVPADIHQYGGQSMERGSSCTSPQLKYFSNPPGNPVECVRAVTYGMDIMPGTTVYYALLEDGKIWAWTYSYSMMDGLIYSVLCTCPGLILGIVAFISFMALRKRKTSKTVVENNQGIILQ
jgi:hypothetical protein